MTGTFPTPSPAPLRLPPLSRRSFLGGIGAASAAVLAGGVAGAGPAAATSAGTVLPLVTALGAGEPDRTLFDPSEQVYAAYLLILAPLANSVVDDDPDRYGWMEDGWQRMPNEPFNARIMEHVATLSWFYAHERAWNPYYLDQNLLGRLDAALGFYLDLQHDDGSWPEYSWTEHGLAPTGFGTVALSAALRDLQATDSLPQRRTEIEATLRSACAWLVDLSRPHWATPVGYVNQVVAGLAGVAQTAQVLTDPAIGTTLADRTAFLLEHGQAPAGFFNEPRSYDAGYNFEVMLPDLGHIYEATGDPSVLELASRWADWFGYVVLMEPGETFGFHYASASARNGAGAFEPRVADDLDRVALGRVFLPQVPKLGAFYVPAEEKQAERERWAIDPEPVHPRGKQDSSPRLYMHVSQAPDGVSAAERDARLSELPYLHEDTWTEVKEGSLIGAGRPAQHFTFVRRPSYYLGALYGVRPYPRQRTGPGFLWHPEAGTVVLGLNNVDDATDGWSTIAAGGTESARSEVTATYHDGPSAIAPEVDRTGVTGHTGVFTTRYTTADGLITTDLTHWHDGVRRSVAVDGAALEQIPIVVAPDDLLEFSDGTRVTPGSAGSTVATGFSLIRGGVRFQFSWSDPLTATVTATGRRFLSDSREQHLLGIEFTGALTLDLTAVDIAATEGTAVVYAATAHTWQTDGLHRTAVQVLNLDTEAIDVRLVTGGGQPLVLTDIAPGQGRFEIVESRRPVSALLAIATTAQTRRTAAKRITS
ncbi:hypothetical protein [Occultella kanbiaonis]|uniref:hypothetical protein n=1 Tax=Occultella kanbiaonis TaxID=2675754 RepID=UPI0012B88C90|nr:hypothetical protein [Occultella kanbiaonis]